MSDGTRAQRGEEPPLRHRILPYLLAALLVLTVKGLLVLSLADVFFYGEVLAKGTAAKAILDGLPVPHYQLAYHYYEGGGFAISHLTALAFRLVGENMLAHELVSLCMNVAMALAGVAFVARNFGRSAAYAFALLFTLAPFTVQKLSLLNLGIHYESSLFLLLAFHFAFRLAFDEAPSRWAAAALGLSCGFGAYFSFQTLPASAFLVALVVLVRQSAVRERWLPFAWFAFLGAAPFFWMWMSVGSAIFDVHGTPLFGDEEEVVEESSSSIIGFILSLGTGQSPLAIALLVLRVVLPIVGAALVARLCSGRPARAVLALLLYLAFFAVVFEASPFAVGPFTHHFALMRLAPFWILGTVLTAALVGTLRSRESGRAARAIGGALLLVLVAAGAEASLRAIREGRPGELAANARLLGATKGYSYPAYFAKFAKRLEGAPEDQLRILLAFDEPDLELLRTSAAEALFSKSTLSLSEVVAIVSAVDPEHWQDYLLGLGPFLMRRGSDVWKALGAAERTPPELRPFLIEAIGRGSHWKYRSDFLKSQLARMRGKNAPDEWYRGVGYNLYLGFRLDPSGAEAFLADVPEKQRDTVRAAYEHSRRLNTLGPD